MSDVNELKWKRQEATIWNDNNVTETDLLKDSYTLQFKPHEDFEDISDVNINVIPNKINIVEVSTKRKKEIGSIKINIFPVVSSTVGVKWRVKNTEVWYSSGDTQTAIEVGLKEIEFQLTAFSAVKEPLNLNVLKNHLTEVDFILTLVGETQDVKEAIFISGISDPDCNRRTPADHYSIDFMGMTNIIDPETIVVPYGQTATVNFNAGYKFKLGGIANDITFGGNVIQNLTENSLTTGNVYNDAHYSFNVQWIKPETETIGLTSDYHVLFSKALGKPKQLEDICIQSMLECSLQKRKAYIENTITESIGEKLISMDFEKRVFKMSSSSENSICVNSCKTVTLDIKNHLKNRSAVTTAICPISDMVSVVTIENKRKTYSMIEKIAIVADILVGMDVTTIYRSNKSFEDLSILSDNFIQVEKYTSALNKNEHVENVTLSSTIECSLVKYNTKFIGQNQTIEEINISSDNSFTMEKVEKENKHTLVVEELGIQSDNYISVDITTKIWSATIAVEEISLVSDNMFILDIHSKEQKNTLSEFVGVISNTVDIVEMKTTNAIKEETDEQVVISSTDHLSMDRHDVRYSLNTSTESVGLMGIDLFNMDKHDVRYERITCDDEISILSNNSMMMSKKVSSIVNNFHEEVGLLSAITISVQKDKKLNKSTISDLNVGLLSSVAVEVDIISHLKKAKLPDEIGMLSSKQLTVDKKSHLIKTVPTTEDVSVLSNDTFVVDKKIKTEVSTTQEDISILSNDSFLLEKNNV